MSSVCQLQLLAYGAPSLANGSITAAGVHSFDWDITAFTTVWRQLSVAETLYLDLHALFYCNYSVARRHTDIGSDRKAIRPDSTATPDNGFSHSEETARGEPATPT